MAAGPSLAGGELAGNPQALPCCSTLSSLHFSLYQRACTLLRVSKQYPSPCCGSGRRAKRGYSQPLSSGDRRRMLERGSWGRAEAWTLFLQLESRCLDSMLLVGFCMG